MWTRCSNSGHSWFIQKIDAIYEHYAEEDGKLYYRKFIEELLFREDEIESNASRLKHSSKINKSQSIENKSTIQSKKQDVDE